MTQPTTTTLPSVRPERHRILVVDDDRHIREVIRFALEKAGFRATEAADGRRALEACRADPPDLAPPRARRFWNGDLFDSTRSASRHRGRVDSCRSR